VCVCVRVCTHVPYVLGELVRDASKRVLSVQEQYMCMYVHYIYVYIYNM